MRHPKQVLVFLYRKNMNDEYEYCIFHRSDHDMWQALSVGVEDDEILDETVKREINEETGLVVDNVYQLSSISSIPVVNITGKFTWCDDVYVVTEYTFGVNVDNVDIKLSNEHKSYEWLSYSDARSKLKYDSNKTALWELNERLIRNNLK